MGDDDATGSVHVIGEGDLWTWNVKAPNGVVVALSPTVHSRREHALRAFRAAQAALRNPLIDAGD